MKAQILEQFLCCPLDKQTLTLDARKREGDEVTQGKLTCTKCGNVFPIEDGIALLLPPRESEVKEVAEAKARESKARDQDSAVYDSTVSGYHTQVELQALLSGLALNRDHIVMELGSGTGRLTVELAKRAGTVVAMDISPQSLRRNREKCQTQGLTHVEHLAVDACYLPIRDARVHRAASAMMLEHLPTADERRRCVEEVRRALLPGGQFILTAYNYSWRKSRKYPRDGFHGNDLYFHNFTPSEMGALLASYRVKKMTALLNLPRKLQWRTLDRAIARVPPLASALGQLLFVVAER